MDVDDRRVTSVVCDVEVVSLLGLREERSLVRSLTSGAVFSSGVADVVVPRLRLSSASSCSVAISA